MTTTLNRNHAVIYVQKKAHPVFLILVWLCPENEGPLPQWCSLGGKEACLCKNTIHSGSLGGAATRCSLPQLCKCAHTINFSSGIHFTQRDLVPRCTGKMSGVKRRVWEDPPIIFHSSFPSLRLFFPGVLCFSFLHDKRSSSVCLCFYTGLATVPRNEMLNVGGFFWEK